MTLGNAAAAGVRLIVWCRDCVIKSSGILEAWMTLMAGSMMVAVASFPHDAVFALPQLRSAQPPRERNPIPIPKTASRKTLVETVPAPSSPPPKNSMNTAADQPAPLFIGGRAFRVTGVTAVNASVSLSQAQGGSPRSVRRSTFGGGSAYSRPPPAAAIGDHGEFAHGAGGPARRPPR